MVELDHDIAAYLLGRSEDALRAKAGESRDINGVVGCREVEDDVQFSILGDDKDVPSFSAGQRVQATPTGEPIIAASANDQVIAPTTIEVVGPLVAFEQVVALATDYAVLAEPAQEMVGAATAVNLVIADSAGNAVVAALPI